MPILFEPFTGIITSDAGAASVRMQASGIDAQFVDGVSFGGGSAVMSVDAEDEGVSQIVIVIPDIGMMSMTMGTASSEGGVTGDVSNPNQQMRVQAFDIELASSAGSGAMYMRANGAEVELPTAYAFYVERPPQVSIMAGYQQMRVDDGISFEDSVTSRSYANIIDGLAFADSGVARARMFNAAESGALFTDLSVAVYQMLVVDGVLFDDGAESTRRQIIAVVDSFLAAGVATSRLTAINVAASALAFADVGAITMREEVTDEFELVDLVTSRMRSFHAALEAVVYADTATVGARFTVFVDDAMAFGDDAASAMTMLELAESGFAIVGSVEVEDGHYVAWVLNAETRAAWQYENYGFNSFARSPVDGRYYGAKDDGIYVLDGDTDEGDLIKARFRTGSFDFGSSAVKRLPMMYVMATRTGELVMKVVINNDDSAQEVHWYRLEGGPTRAKRQDRVKPDKGLETVDFEFEMINVNGADFEIDSMRVLPMLTSRRI